MVRKKKKSDLSSLESTGEDNGDEEGKEILDNKLHNQVTLKKTFYFSLLFELDSILKKKIKATFNMRVHLSQGFLDKLNEFSVFFFAY